MAPLGIYEQRGEAEETLLHITNRVDVANTLAELAALDLQADGYAPQCRTVDQRQVEMKNQRGVIATITIREMNREVQPT